VKSFFVTGTDTGIGKTVISTGLSSFFSIRKKIMVGVMKPFETGYKRLKKGIYLQDSFSLKKASGSMDSLEKICPYAFKEPLAPEPASKFDRVTIKLAMLDKIYKEMLTRHDIVIVEGAGGILVPIKKGFFFADLIKRWDIPVLIVARLGLGTINHTLLTAQYLQSKGIKIIGVILNDIDGIKTKATQTNPSLLKRYLKVPILGIFPHIKGFPGKRLNRELLAATVAKHIDTETILKNS
jgi:dethiobiotin synthetase